MKRQLTAADAHKIDTFAFAEPVLACDDYQPVPNPTIVLAQIPNVDAFDICCRYTNSYIFNFVNIDSDNYAAAPVINRNGAFALVGGDYIDWINSDATARAYAKARGARFEHGEVV